MSTTSQYITVRETAQMLGITEKKVMDLIDQKKLQAYRIAGQFLRLKKAEVVSIRNVGEVANEAVRYEYLFSERIHDFFYYNDFYIFSLIIIISLLYVIFFV